jgi:hypothetical protein
MAGIRRARSVLDTRHECGDPDHETRVLMSVRANNGQARTGRSFLRSAYARQADIESVAVNDLAARILSRSRQRPATERLNGSQR